MVIPLPTLLDRNPHPDSCDRTRLLLEVGSSTPLGLESFASRSAVAVWSLSVETFASRSAESALKRISGATTPTACVLSRFPEVFLLPWVLEAAAV